MKIGTLRNRVTFQKRPTSKDSYGQKSGDWTAVISDRPCNIIDLTGRELANVQAITSEVTVKLVLRGFTGWRSMITPDMRVVAGSRTFDIKMVINPDGRDRELNILAKEIVR